MTGSCSRKRWSRLQNKANAASLPLNGVGLLLPEWRKLLLCLQIRRLCAMIEGIILKITRATI